WYALVLLGVVAGFAGILYYRAREARLRETDARLEADVLYLDVSLRAFPPHELDGSRPEKPPRDRDKGKGFEPPPGRPPPRPPQRLLAELTLRGVPAADPGDGRARPYFAVWRGDGSVLKASALPAELTSDAAADAQPRQPRLRSRGEHREA